MVYRLPLFLVLFSLTGTMHVVMGAVRLPFVVSLVVSLMASSWSDSGLQIPSTLILSFSASGLNRGIWVFVEALLSRFVSQNRVSWLRLWIPSFALVFLLLETTWILYSRIRKEGFRVLPWQAATFLTAIFHVHVLLLLSTTYPSFQRDSSSHSRMISLLVPTLPCLVIGKVTHIFWTETCDASSWGFASIVVMPIYLWLLFTIGSASRPKRSNHVVITWAKPCMIVFGFLSYGSRLICTGCAFRVAYLLSLVTCLDIVEIMLIRICL